MTSLQVNFILYNYTNDLIGVFPTYSQQLLISEMTTIPRYYVAENVNTKLMKITFVIEPLIIEITETPFSLINGLASIGGLLGIAFLANILILMIHRCTFKESLKSLLKETVNKKTIVNDKEPADKNVRINNTDESQLLNNHSTSVGQIDETLDDIDVEDIESLFSYKCYRIAIK